MSKQGVASMLALALLLGASMLVLALLLGAFAATPTGEINTYPVVFTAGIHASRVIH